VNREIMKNRIQVVKIDTLEITSGEYPFAVMAYREPIVYSDQTSVAAIKKKLPGNVPDVCPPCSTIGRRTITTTPISPVRIPTNFCMVSGSRKNLLARMRVISGTPA
jgi:hypothetical protein